MPDFALSSWGDELEDMTRQLFEAGAEVVYRPGAVCWQIIRQTDIQKVISDAIHEFKPEIVLYGATHIGQDLAPRVAARVNTGLTADCTGWT